MKTKHIILFFLCGIFLACTGCKKYLQVDPVGTYTENQVFTNKKAVEQALNGLYIKLGSNELYGSALTQTYIELMAQQFRAFQDGIHFYEQYQRYDYDAVNPRETFQNIWSTAYSTILFSNLFLQKIDLSINNGVVTEEQGKLLKGEVIGIRALLHFDLLRIFGPAYDPGASKPSIPYYTKANAEVQPFSTSAQVITNVLNDLDAALLLLAEDAIIQSGVVRNDNFYSGHRNQRMNYYAVKALKARVYLWAGKKAEAHAAALEVLTAGEQWFPWLPEEAIKSPDSPDRIFSTELLFAVYNREMYNNYAAYYSPTLTESYLLTPQITSLRGTFENNENDYRFSSTWKLIPGRTVRAFYKYQDVSAPQAWGFLQPMIRKSELYYILAETETDDETAIGYINSVRENRGLQHLPANATPTTEILKEYKKEFYGEGQLFFYYKRTNTPSLQDAVDGTSITPLYIVPIPLSETTPR